MQPLSCAYHSIQLRLIPALDEVVGPLGERDRELVRAYELTAPLLPKVLGPSDYCGLGRPQADRHKLFRAFIAKSVMGFATTEMLIEQLKGNATLRFLCGWDSRGEVPSASTFSRAFAEFAQSGAAAQIHAMLVEATHREKIVGHCSKDSTAIHARERHCRIHDKPLKQKRKRGRRPRHAPVPPPPEPRRLQLQPTRSLQANLCDLPKGCDWGIKKNSQGKCEQWRGYKLHLDFSDAGVPLSAILSSASVHDSQVAVPLMQMTTGRIRAGLYDLMDAAYDAREIHEFSRSLGHVPVIDPNPRGSAEPIPLDPAKTERYKERSAAERGNSELKDNFGLENIRVKGHWKVSCHVMFCVLALTSKTLFNMIC